ncbi:FadR/GntR family transcriptional regulator [Paenibacillus sp. J2TS4]|uniref:FadR/GntR family transcriptional regulator n=1 Tax=Paenibacillus sp. J2TS4 TaxID=2807194 RepID=UPI001B178534|nr:FadR/GntR family transcriptional regulator [Paenibacillus sp. J2TS4]GIP32344.1 GntR family transcriptional regulator [Paenibacillus sp. J2TS4]
MNVKQVNPQKSYEIVMNDIQSRISSGELEPGRRLPSVVDLAANYGVGRSTLREALSALKAMGWLEIRQGGGTFVSQTLPSEGQGGFPALFHHTDSLKEMMEVRKVLETGCATLAARNRTEEDLAELASILDSMKACSGDDKKEEEADLRFHLQIAKASHNSLLLQMMESLTHKLEETIKETRQLWFYGERATANRLTKEHQGIYEAILRQEEEAASQRMLEHLTKVEKVLSQFF